MTYLAFKFVHVFIAIVAIGSSAALSLVLGFFAGDPAHGVFALRLVRRLLWLVVVPGYVLMLVTGMWMGHLADLLDAHWAEMARQNGKELHVYDVRDTMFELARERGETLEEETILDIFPTALGAYRSAALEHLLRRLLQLRQRHPRH